VKISTGELGQWNAPVERVLLLVEGRWRTGAGLSSAALIELVCRHRSEATVEQLDDPIFWDGRSTTSGTCSRVHADVSSARRAGLCRVGDVIATGYLPLRASRRTQVPSGPARVATWSLSCSFVVCMSP
jgi:hypothetical protein